MNNDLCNRSVLEVNKLSIRFRMYEKGLKQRDYEVISDFSLSIGQGEILAVVGSSGSGKSLLAHAILGILPANAMMKGEMGYRGERLTPELQQKLRGKEIAFVPQSVTYLDPLMKVGKQVEGVKGTAERRERAFKRYGLPDGTDEKYPFQLSGGMARRVLLSTAVMDEPKLIVADEPTPGLNPQIAEEAMRHFRELADQGCAVLLITHDIDLAFQAADKIAVLYAGTIVEIAPVADFIQGGEALRHPYSRALWNALPQNGFLPLPGSQPSGEEWDGGCRFAARCSDVTTECRAKVVMRPLRGGEVRCTHAT